jgi:hypothetical protein
LRPIIFFLQILGSLCSILSPLGVAVYLYQKDVESPTQRQHLGNILQFLLMLCNINLKYLVGSVQRKARACTPLPRSTAYKIQDLTKNKTSPWTSYCTYDKCRCAVLSKQNVGTPRPPLLVHSPAAAPGHDFCFLRTLELIQSLLYMCSNCSNRQLPKSLENALLVRSCRFVFYDERRLLWQLDITNQLR